MVACVILKKYLELSNIYVPLSQTRMVTEMSNRRYDSKTKRRNYKLGYKIKLNKNNQSLQWIENIGLVSISKKDNCKELGTQTPDALASRDFDRPLS
jgi:hypothetical protein